MSVVELTKDKPKEEESAKRTGLFSSLFSGETRCGLAVTNERERFDALAKAAEGELSRKGSSIGERHKAAKELTEAVISNKAFNLGLLDAAEETVSGRAVKVASLKSKARFEVLHKVINWVLVFAAIPLLSTGLIGTAVGAWVTAGLMCLIPLNNTYKSSKVSVAKRLVLPLSFGLLALLVLSGVISGLPAIILEILAAVVIYYLLSYIVLPEDESVSVVTREPTRCLVDSEVSDYTLSVIKRCFDTGVISDSCFSTEAEDTASGDEVYKRVSERVRVSALLAVLRGDKESISLKALLRKTDRGEGA